MIRFVIKRPVLIGMLFVGLCLLGVVSYFYLPVELIPFTELPMLVVQVQSVRDADPVYIEQQAVVTLEGAIGSLEDIDQIESYIDRQRATILVYYNENANIKYSYLRLQERVDEAAASLGSDFRVLVLKVDTEQLANLFMTLQVRGTGGLDRIRHIVDDEVISDLENIDGVANVEAYGGTERSIEILLDADAMRAAGITPQLVESKISAGRGSRQFLGNVEDGGKQYFVNLTSEYTSISELENTIIKDKGPVLLKHIAEIRDGGKERTSISRINGLEAVTISLIRDSQANLISLSHETRHVIDNLNRKLASDSLDIVVQSDAAEIIEENINMIKELALIGGLLAVIILWIFLRNLRIVFIIATAIPISILVSLNFFYAFGISINTLTLVGIGLAIGMLLDNSVVVLESIYRKKSLGIPTEKAVVDGTGEVLRAIIAATLTTICVFLPFVYSGNFLIRTIGKHVGVSIIATLLVSLVVALLLIPAFTYRAFRQKSRSTTRSFFNVVSQRNRLLQLYTLLLKSTLRFPARTIITGTVIFFLSVIICLALSIGVPQQAELSEFNLYAQFPSGTTLDAADELVSDMESRLDDIAEVDERLVNIYEDDAVFTFKLKDDYKKIAGRDVASIKNDVMDKLHGPFPRVEFSYEQPTSNTHYRGGGGGGGFAGGGGGGRGSAGLLRLLGIGSQREQIIVKGQNFSLMSQVANQIKYNLDEQDYIDRTWINVSEGRPEIQLIFDRQALSHFGVTLADVMADMSSFQQEYSSSVNYKDGDDEVEIVLHNASLEDKTADDIRSLEITTAQGASVPLLQLADMIYSTGVVSINRVNQEKEIDVSYRFSDAVNGSKSLLENSRLEVEQLASSTQLPPGIAVEVLHDETDYSEFYFLIAAAAVLIFMVLASAFESFATPIVMMVTIPLATIGAFWGLIFTGQSVLNANVLIGFLILLGVVVNNGIILIDYSRILQKRGYRLPRALVAAGQARVRPILITALTTIVAMFPLAMGKAEYVAQIGAPFAITVIGGLTAGTLFTLVFIPTVYSAMIGVLAWWKRLGIGIRILQFALFAAGCWFIYYDIDSLTWRLAALCALTGVIPGTVYFTMTSLRRASATIIPPGDPIKITVRNVVKVYGDYSRFVREFHKAERQRDRFEREHIGRDTIGLYGLAWQMPVYAFALYFVYWYLESNFWLFILVHPVYISTIVLGRRLLIPDHVAGGGLRHGKLRRILFKAIFWGLPLVNLVIFQLRWDLIVLEAIIGAIWYLSLAIYSTSRKLYRENVNIARITGRFRGIRKLFYRFVKKIPVIGKKKQPFRALNQVSMEIGSGMFGLVGPNGAGKTTLMRIICGVLDQSRGSIRINGIDLNEKREELQGLIGYLPQEFGTYENMTAYQFLDQQAMLRGILDSSKRRAAVERAIRSVHLEENRDNKIKSFSGGMKQRVGIAQTLLHLPRILVVDEPTAGLDPRERIRFRNLLSELARDRVVIFSTHVIEDISSSCNRVAVLGDGVVKFLGTPQQMVERTRGNVWQTFLTEEEFDSARSTLKVVHHMRDGDRIRVRMLASKQPLPDAIEVTPTLEDAYLWLIGKQS